jgi:hypothetical protein
MNISKEDMRQIAGNRRTEREYNELTKEINTGFYKTRKTYQEI